MYVKEGERYVAPDWNITFNMDDIPDGQAVLTIAIASVNMRSGDFRVFVNDSEVAHYDYILEDRLASSVLYADGAIRSGGIQGFYRKAVIRFDMSLLQEGVNTITLRQSGANSCYFGIIYDCIRLEHVKN